MRIFRKGPGPHALPLAVVGLRLGNRFLDVGARQGALFAEMAGKVGLTGHACAVVGSEPDAVRVKAAAARAGVLADVEVTAWPGLPVGDASFDVAVVDNTDGLLASLGETVRAYLAEEVLRALRPGGRALVLDRQPRGVLAALAGRGAASWPPAASVAAWLTSAGFRPVRLLAEREGQRFTEGWKPAGPQGSAG
ncbi:MAG: methyltransferase domain-containing protein [Acidobacteria bacterium]|nr:methyltransferase domain-containing protein [Acidobacteriota bacterium]